MAESMALVPVPDFSPVGGGTNSGTRFSDFSRLAGRGRAHLRLSMPESASFPAYGRNGYLLAFADEPTGLHIDLYI